MKQKTKRARRISVKVLCLILVMSLLLAGAAVAFSYVFYGKTMDDHYKTLTGNIAQSAADMLDPRDVGNLTSAVMRIYREQIAAGNTPESEDEDVVNAYYTAFEGIEDLQAYKNCMEVLEKLEDDNGADCLYICYMDLETDKAVYIIDAAHEDACSPGDRDPIEDENRELMLKGDYTFPAYITNYGQYGWLCSAACGVKTANGTYIANAYADYSMTDIMNERHNFLKVLVIALLLIAAVLSVLLILFVRKSIVKPINQLSRAARKYVSSRDTSGPSEISKLNIRTKDEIQTLSESIKKMEEEINDYIDNLALVSREKERIGAELNVATQIQASVLPSTFPAFPDRSEFDIYAMMHPAKEVGGDFYDFFLIDNDHFAIVMADVSGKGVPAALFMMAAKNLLKSSALTMPSPKDILEHVNKQLCEGNDAEMFVTVWLGILEISTGRMLAANAGHEFPAIRRKDGRWELFKDKHGFVLAGMETARYKEYELNFEPGDKLFLYTDGVTEATDANNELFGTDRMLEALNDADDAAPHDVLTTVRQHINGFVKQAPQFDDITMLCFELKGSGEVRKVLNARTDNVTPEDVRQFVEGVLTAKNVEHSAATKLYVAVDEIVTNILQYSGAQSLDITCSANDEKAVITFSDDGIPYNPLEREDPDVTLSAEERKIGGLGIYMVKKTMDAVEYESRDGRNILTITKNTNSID